jgi:hypothetical protein
VEEVEMKKLFIILILLTSVVFAINKENFVLNIINSGNPVREIDGIAVVPFNSEYELLLKNDNNRRCVANITIDGTNISNYGEFVINANGELNLERFVTESLNEGKRFKFVTLDNPAIDDPTRKENGIVKVEFRLEKKRNPELYIMPYGWFNLDSIFIPEYQNIGVTLCACNDASAGATIAGGESEQRFGEVEFDAEEKSIVLELRLKGVK